MASGTFFVRDCPTCGRKLEVRVELLGRDVECIHCGAGFNTRESSQTACDDLRIEQIIARAQQYVASTQSLNSTTTE
ncbi:hypothetical protein [Aureliella helgolandensis]|uniref:Uncharacterized protein n=1 Tax=Aureliella helgolandensis TaxID=2527968 RepID=A0A518GEJ0_9BACT|nr:hypothetical protein [Aureliella helgolandensis]QDV27013.1 hypothetical protein Q31a_53940 [Aureliella helgolandensis]